LTAAIVRNALSGAVNPVNAAGCTVSPQSLHNFDALFIYSQIARGRRHHFCRNSCLWQVGTIMVNVKVYQYEVLDTYRVERRKARQWGTREAINGLNIAYIIEGR
jgi:hypothetical protein